MQWEQLDPSGTDQMKKLSRQKQDGQSYHNEHQSQNNNQNSLTHMDLCGCLINLASLEVKQISNLLNSAWSASAKKFYVKYTAVQPES